MAICKMEDEKLVPISETSYKENNCEETTFLRPLLRKSIEDGSIEEILPDLMIVAEEFNAWSNSNRRIDLLAVDQDANLIVIEIKRSNHGDHSELQAIRYAAMIADLTFEKTAEALLRHMINNGDESVTLKDASEKLTDFFNWNGPDETLFGKEVKIVIAAAGFSDELATSVMYLRREYNMDIKCLAMVPYENGDEMLIDVDIVIPRPEMAKMEIKSFAKKQNEKQVRAAKAGKRKKYTISVMGKMIGDSLLKKESILAMVKAIVQNGHSPAEIKELVFAMPERFTSMFEIIEGERCAEEVKRHIARTVSKDKATRFFCERDEDIFKHEGNTYVLSNQWGRETEAVMSRMAAHFSRLNIKIDEVTQSSNAVQD